MDLCGAEAGYGLQSPGLVSRKLLCALWLVPGLLCHGSILSAEEFETWVERRDHGVVRQERDFSCGLAALATILSWSVGESVTESELLRELLVQLETSTPRSIAQGGVSFADLARLAAGRGHSVLGVEVPVAAFTTLRRPAIVALQADGQAHFSVLRAVDEDKVVWLADPTWGNRRLSMRQFERLFAHYPGAGPQEPRGRVLLVSSATPPPRTPDGFGDGPVPVYLAPRL